MRSMKFVRLVVGTAVVGLVALAALEACGGDSGGGPGGAGSDEAYVRAVCGAFAKFEEDFTKLLSDPEALSDEDALTEKFAGVYRTFVDSVAKARPPADVREYHDAFVSQLRTSLDAAEKGDLESAFAESSDLPAPPQDVQDRLQKVADGIEECRDLSIFGQ